MPGIYEIEGQVLFFRFETEDALLPANYSATVVDDLRKLAAQGPTGLMATISPNVRLVDTAVLNFWLKQVQDKSLRISAISVVTQRLSIRVVVQSFAQATRVLGVNLDMQSFPELPQARSWIQERLALRAVAAS